MAERKAVNKYYPPEWDPSKGSINKFVGQHPLRERARKLDQGILIVRFEMPFNIWCGKCKQHIGKGVRFNAEKKQIGKYFSTKIWSFRMKCHLCANWMEIQTDPKNSDYIVVSGAQKKNETWISGPEDGTIQLLNEEESQKLATDPFYKLEYSNLDKKKAEDTIPIIQELVKLKDNLKDDYSLSSLLRKNFREKKKEIEKLKKEGEDKGLNCPLLPLDETDKEIASKIKFKNNSFKKLEEKSLKRKLEIKSSSLFGTIKPEEKKLKLKLLLAKHQKNGLFSTINNNNNNNNNNNKKRKI